MCVVQLKTHRSIVLSLDMYSVFSLVLGQTEPISIEYSYDMGHKWTIRILRTFEDHALHSLPSDPTAAAPLRIRQLTSRNSVRCLRNVG
jgi:hypothetical protein